MVFPPIWGEKWRRSEHAHASYPGLFFRPPGLSPYMGREERRVQGLDYSRCRSCRNRTRAQIRRHWSRPVPLAFLPGFTMLSRAGVLFITPTIPEISLGIKMKRSVSVSSDRNIRHHLWSSVGIFPNPIGWLIAPQVSRGSLRNQLRDTIL